MVSNQAHIPGEVSKTDPRGVEKGQRGPFRHTGRQETFILSCFRKARKHIHHQKNHKVFGTSHFPHCWEQSFTCFKTAFSFPVLMAGDCYQAGSKTLPDCHSPPPSAGAAHGGH